MRQPAEPSGGKEPDVLPQRRQKGPQEQGRGPHGAPPPAAGHHRLPPLVGPPFVGRRKSIAALEGAMSHGKDIPLAAQEKAKANEAAPGCLLRVRQLGANRQPPPPPR